MSTQTSLELSNISKSYGVKTILDGVSLSINRHDRIGLVGENGAGKTTLANILMGGLEPDAGQLSAAPGTQIGYLPQEAQIDEAVSVQLFLERASGRVDELAQRLTTLEHLMSAPNLPPGKLSIVLADYSQCQEEYTRRGGYDADHRFDVVLAGLDLAHIDRARAMPTLSGGEKTRSMLASLLLGAPDLLILDEPTNHLDFAAVDWLESYLVDYPGALLVISHDRRFLNRVVTQIAELSVPDHRLHLYMGNYDAYLAERERLRVKQQTAYEEQRDELRELRREIKLKTHNRAAPPPPTDGNKMAYNAHGQKVQQVRSRELKNLKQRVAVIEDNRLEGVARRWQINPEFAPEALTSQAVIRLVGLTKSYGDRVLFQDVSETIRAGERVVLQGRNGLGKTTLLRLIMGIELPDSGQVRVAGGARIGYLDQEQESLPYDCTVLDEFARGLALPEAELRAALHKYGLFKEEQVFQPISSLSIGQRRKLQIARLIALKANVLLLDEPTNHLDLESVAEFEHALCEFPGTLLAISHDRYFIERVATRVWTFKAGQLVTV